jgi:hypothetical protein
MAGLTLDTAGALTAARDLGAAGWAAAERLLAIRIGMAEGAVVRQDGAATRDQNIAGPQTLGT